VVIDFHTHIVPPAFKENREKLARDDNCLGELFRDPNLKMVTADELVESMDGDGIEVSVAVNMGWSSLELCRESNDYIMSAVARYPDRIVGFGIVDPRWEQAEREVERCAAGGLRGIGELMPHLQGYALDDRELMTPVMEAAARHNMVVLTHSSEPVGHVYQGKGDVFPSTLYRFINNFPQARIVCAHWGGGLPFYALMPEVGRLFENVWFDTAASPFLYKYGIFSIVSSILGAGKILFGSDFPLITQKRIIDGLHQKTDIPEAEKELIIGKNAQMLLGLE